MKTSRNIASGRYHRKAIMTIEEHSIFSRQVGRFCELKQQVLNELREPNARQQRIKAMVNKLVSGYMPGLEFDSEAHTVWEKPKQYPYSEMSEWDFHTRVDLLWHLYGIESQSRWDYYHQQVMETLLNEFDMLYITEEW